MKKILLVFLLIVISTNAYGKEWYVGGTLHNANAMEWQSASFQNKLATCSDFVSKAWKNKSFKPEIQSKITSMDTIMILSKELVKGLDAAFERDPDPKKNEIAYKNQEVSSFAAMLMVMMGWVDV